MWPYSSGQWSIVLPSPCKGISSTDMCEEDPMCQWISPRRRNPYCKTKQGILSHPLNSLEELEQFYHMQDDLPPNVVTYPNYGLRSFPETRSKFFQVRKEPR